MLALLAYWNVVEFTVYRGVGTAFFLNWDFRELPGT